MNDYLTVVVILIISLVLGYYDTRNHKSYLTPFIFMAVPYVAVVIMINTIGGSFGFFKVNLKSVLFVAICLSFFKFGGWFSTFIYRQKDIDSKISGFNRSELEALFKKYSPLFVILAIISIIASIIHFNNALHEVGGWIHIAGKDFEDAYGKGLLSHVSQLSRPAFTFLFAYYFYSKKKYVLLLLAAMFISVVVLQIKAHIITTLLSGVIFASLLNVIKINFKKLILFSFIILLLFNVSYMVGFSRIGVSNAYNSKVQLYLMYQFFTYLFGGVLGLSGAINDSLYPIFRAKEIFAIPINIYNAITGSGELVDVIVRRWIPISTNHKYFHSTNVFTLFGMLYMYLGSFYTYIYMFITGVIAYILKAVSFRKKAAIGFQMTYAFYLSFISLSFFDIFFNQLQIYHTSFLMIVIPLCYDTALKIRRIIRVDNSRKQQVDNV